MIPIWCSGSNDEIRDTSAESGFDSTTEDVSTNQVITPGIGNEPDTDNSQQEEDNLERGEVKYTSYNLSFTEKEARDTREINFDNDFGQTDFKNRSLEVSHKAKKTYSASDYAEEFKHTFQTNETER